MADLHHHEKVQCTPPAGAPPLSAQPVNNFSFRPFALTYIYNPERTSFHAAHIYQSGTEVGAMVPHAEANEIKTMPDGGLHLPRVSKPADENDVMREQLEYLIGHVADRGLCGCSECQRYLRVRGYLLEIFSEPAPKLAAVATMPMAA
jgi:hypothetical protein